MLSISTPADVFDGGLDLTINFQAAAAVDGSDLPVDIAGASRTATSLDCSGPSNFGAEGWSMGAYEYEFTGGCE